MVSTEDIARMRMSRRKFLFGTAVITTAAATGAAFVARPYLARQLYPELDTAYPLGVLNDNEMRTITALGEVLAAPTFEPAKGFFEDYVNLVTQTERGLLKEYKSAAALLNATSTRLFGQGAEATFAGLSVLSRDQVLHKLLWQYSARDRIVPKVEKITASHDALALRVHVMEPLIVYYYRSQYGWSVVGYKSYPGRPPLDPRAYTRQPNETEVTT
jgi:hypothetical protein